MRGQIAGNGIAAVNSRGGFRLSSGRVLPTTPVFDSYWLFAHERQEVFYKRIEGTPAPWTTDPILGAYRFTNVYRASDRVSQYLIRHVIYSGDQSVEEVFFRTLLFKLFNRIDTWRLLVDQLGQVSWRSFNFERYEAILGHARDAGGPIYSSAYIMPPPRLGANRKHGNHLRLLEKMMRDNVPAMISEARTLAQVYEILRNVPSFGNFLGFQFAIDLNYSDIVNFSEMDFVVAGPGARSGIRKAFVDLGGLTDEEVIDEVTNAADREFKQRGLMFRKLWDRPLQLIDCQNLFCEIDKYSRVAFPSVKGDGRTRIKRTFTPASALDPQWYPPKWGLNVGENISSRQSQFDFGSSESPTSSVWPAPKLKLIGRRRASKPPVGG